MYNEIIISAYGFPQADFFIPKIRQVVTMNEQNLIVPSSSEARENGSKGGKASGAARRKKRDMKQCMELLLSLPA